MGFFSISQSAQNCFKFSAKTEKENKSSFPWFGEKKQVINTKFTNNNRKEVYTDFIIIDWLLLQRII